MFPQTSSLSSCSPCSGVRTEGGCGEDSLLCALSPRQTFEPLWPARDVYLERPTSTAGPSAPMFLRPIRALGTCCVEVFAHSTSVFNAVIKQEVVEEPAPSSRTLFSRGQIQSNPFGYPVIRPRFRGQLPEMDTWAPSSSRSQEPIGA